MFTYVPELQRIGLGGGCHWCTEGIFVSLHGVVRVEQGWIASAPPHTAPSEAVIVHYDPTMITARQLIEVHLETHASGTEHALRSKYRSAVYFFSAEAREEYDAIIGALGGGDGRSNDGVTVRILYPLVGRHQDYFRRDPERPFCRRYITPKLTVLQKSHPDLFFSEKQ